MRAQPPKPMLATPAAALPAGDAWTYEVKWDGYRTLGVKDADRAILYSRNLKDVSGQYPSVARALKSLDAAAAVVDGELVALDEEGRPSFQALHHQSARGLVYVVFDVLHLNGRALAGSPLRERRAALTALRLPPPMLLSEVLAGTVERIEEAVRELGFEGVVAKRADSRYEAGRRSRAWLKVKFQTKQEFVIGGFTEDQDRVDALVVGYYQDRVLLAAGKVRAGLTPTTRRQLRQLLLPLRTKTCPFANLPDSKTSHWGEGITAEEMSEIVWLRPRYVAEVAFTEWTRDAHLRHATFVSLRTDKRAREVRREP